MEERLDDREGGSPAGETEACPGGKFTSAQCSPSHVLGDMPCFVGVPIAATPECPICFSPYDGAFRMPLRLPHCTHTFCLHCLSRMSLFPTVPDTFRCPLCRAPVPLPPGGAPCLPPNMEVLSKLPLEQAGSLTRVWQEGPELCCFKHLDGEETAPNQVVRMQLTGAPPGGHVRADQSVTMVQVRSQRRFRGCRGPYGNIWCLGTLSALIFVMIFFGIFLPVYFQR